MVSYSDGRKQTENILEQILEICSLQVLGVRRWRELVANRKKEKDIVRQAKAHSGL